MIRTWPLVLLAACDLLALTPDPIAPTLPDWESCEWSCTHDPHTSTDLFGEDLCRERCEAAQTRCRSQWTDLARCVLAIEVNVIEDEGCDPDRAALLDCLGTTP